MFTPEQIINFIRRQFSWVKGSGDSSPHGASSKKLTGFWFLVCLTGPIVLVWLCWAAWHGNWDYLMPVLGLLVTAGLTALGIATNEKIKLTKIQKENNDAPPQ